MAPGSGGLGHGSGTGNRPPDGAPPRGGVSASGCREVSRSGCYRWIAGAKARAERQAAEDALVAEIREVHTARKGTYGFRRVHAELRGFGHAVNRMRVERLMRQHRIEGRHLLRRKRTTVPDRLAPPAPDLSNIDSLLDSWTRSGAATSPTLRSAGRGCFQSVSGASVHAGCSAGRWPHTCARNWSSTP
ncbi:hypothetical protein AV521_45390 [Streptomyces sp. IMTB 2501]|uniref:IS3 family transposase n=1 Tax=Streptomyces sp. IMTB 2501 TaxID=1776340 RepID=UPI00097A71A9|nr:hypothetical protein AV521_45390 [Streptomyces sp. IMTB 2501]